MQFVAFIVGIIFFVFALYILYQSFVSISYVPSSAKRAEKILKEYGLNSTHSFVDLGSGDGRIVYRIRRHTGNSFGIESNLLLVLLCRTANAFRSNKGNFNWGSLYQTDLSNYNYIYCYLAPKMMAKLEQKLERELKPGTILVSKSFKLPNTTPISEAENHYYVYKF